jgi:hypothetical protein
VALAIFLVELKRIELGSKSPLHEVTAGIWCDVLGCPLSALYSMHGVNGAFHGFVELAPESYIAFVQHPDPGDADQP